MVKRKFPILCCHYFKLLQKFCISPSHAGQGAEPGPSDEKLLIDNIKINGDLSLAWHKLSVLDSSHFQHSLAGNCLCFFSMFVRKINYFFQSSLNNHLGTLKKYRLISDGSGYPKLEFRVLKV